MKTKKKGFTLVELLVVIAILAILATVSVVGYLSFTEKAKISNAETEMAQIREVIRGNLLDGSEITIDGETNYTLAYEGNKVTATQVTDSETATVVEWDVAFPDLASFNDDGKTIVIDANGITYTNGDVKAVWNFADDTIKGSTIAE